MTTVTVWGRTDTVLRSTEARAEHLTDPEITRLRELRDGSARDDYLAAHLLVRVAARRTAITPGPLTLVQKCRTCGYPHGQPRFLESPTSYVSLAHASGAVVAAVSTKPIGVDLERDGATDLESIRPILDGEEAHQLSTVPAVLDAVQIWCRKEAAAKALGRGVDVMAHVRTVDGRGPRRQWGNLVWSELRSGGFTVCVAAPGVVAIRSLGAEHPAEQVRSGRWYRSAPAVVPR